MFHRPSQVAVSQLLFISFCYFFSQFLSRQTTKRESRKIKFDTRQRTGKKIQLPFIQTPMITPNFNEILICVTNTHTHIDADEITFIVRPAVKVDFSSLTIPNVAHPSVILRPGEEATGKNVYICSNVRWLRLDIYNRFTFHLVPCANKIVFYFNRRNIRTCVS